MHSDESGPLPAGWERRIDHLRRNYYVNRNTRTTTWHRPSIDQGVNNTEQQAAASYHYNSYQRVDEALDDGDSSTHVPQSASTMSPVAAQQRAARSNPFVSSPASWEKRRTQEGGVYFSDRKSNLDLCRPNEADTSRPLVDNTRLSTRDDPCTQDQAPIPAPGSNLGPLPSGWEMRFTASSGTYFVDHNTNSSTWHDPRLPSPVAPDVRHDFRGKMTHFRSQPAMRFPIGEVHIKVRRNYIFEDSYKEIMRNSPNDLKKILIVTFEGRPVLDSGGISRSVAQFTSRGTLLTC